MTHTHRRPNVQVIMTDGAAEFTLFSNGDIEVKLYGGALVDGALARGAYETIRRELMARLPVAPKSLIAVPIGATEDGRPAENGEQPEAIISAWGDSFRRPQEALLEAMAGGEPAPVPPVPGRALSDVDLLDTTDAAIWAREFCRIASNLGHEGIDEGWMVTWFASAMAAQEFKTARERASQGGQ